MAINSEYQEAFESIKHSLGCADKEARKLVDSSMMLAYAPDGVTASEAMKEVLKNIK